MTEARPDARQAGDRVWTLKNGTQATIRPACADDEPALAAFHRELSDRSLFLRYFNVSRVEHRVDRPTSLDASHALALSLVVETMPADGKPAIVGIGALAPSRDGTSGEMAILVADAYQRLGLGAELLRRLIAAARQHGMRSIAGEMLPENEPMIALARRLGFTLTSAPDDARVIRATMML